MKRNILLAFTLLFICISLFAGAQEIPASARLIKGGAPKISYGNDRVMGLTSTRLDYIKSDSAYFPLSYFMSYMFMMNSRYTVADTGAGLTNEYLLQGFGVMYDTLRFVRPALPDTAYVDSVMQNFTIDSVSMIIGHTNHSGSGDTIIVQIDSVDATGYIYPKVLHADTLVTSAGLSPGNDWLNPVTVKVKPGYLLLNKTHRFAIMVSYYDNTKLDTLGFLPGFGYSNCINGGSGPIPKQTQIGYTFGTLRANSLTWGYKYFFGGVTDTIPKTNGSTSGLIVPCSNPNSRYWFFQDNPITVYVSFNNVTGTPEVKDNSYTITPNYPNPFNKATEIGYDLKKESAVEFYITDLAGRRLIYQSYPEMPRGRHTVKLEASQFSPGIYLYTFIINGSAVTGKMAVSQ